MFELTTQPVIGVDLNLSNLQSPVEHRPQALMVCRHARVTHLARLHPCTQLVLGQMNILLVKPCVEVVDSFHRQVLPARNLSVFEHLIAKCEILHAGALANAQHLCTFLNPINERRIVTTILSHAKAPHLAPDFRHVNLAAFIQTLVHLLFNERRQILQTIIQDVRIVRVLCVLDGASHKPILTHAHARINIIWFTVHRHAHLDGAFLTLLSPASVVIY